MRHKNILEWRGRETWGLSLVLTILLSLVLGYGFIYPAFVQQHVLEGKIIQAERSQAKQSVEMFGRVLNFSEVLSVFNASSFSGIKVLTLMQEGGSDHLVVRGDAAALKLLMHYFAPSHLVSAELQREANAQTYALDLLLNDVRVDDGVALQSTSVQASEAPSVLVVGEVAQNGHHYCVLKSSGKINFVERRQC